MTAFWNSLLPSLLLLLLTARALGELSRRLGQPPLLGEMAAGVLLGPALLGWVQGGPGLDAITELATFFIVLGAGLELGLAQVLGGFRRGGWIIAALSFLLPMAAGWGVGALFGLAPPVAFFLGLCVSVTALPVAVRLLQSMGLMQTPLARYALASAVAGDLVVLLALAVLLAQGGASGATGMEAAGRLGLLLGLLALAWWVQRRFQPAIQTLVRSLTRHMGAEAVFGLTCLFTLCFTALAQGLGFPGVLGTFFGAAVLDRGLLGPRHDRALHRSLRSISDGFLAAVFFATLGLRFSGGILDQVPLLLAVLALSVASKLAAGWLGGRLAGLSAQESMGLGAILNARGVMELVVAQVALQQGLIGGPLYSVLVLMGLSTTLLTPFLVPSALRRPAQG